MAVRGVAVHTPLTPQEQQELLDKETLVDRAQVALLLLVVVAVVKVRLVVMECLELVEGRVE